MPYDSDAMVLRTLLGTCRSCGDIEYASELASRLLELEPGEHSTYVLLSDMYRQFKKWDEIANIKRLMRERSIVKVLGSSWIEVQNEFVGIPSISYLGKPYRMKEKKAKEKREAAKELKQSIHLVPSAPNKEPSLTVTLPPKVQVPQK
ncbi:hypothetical protein T459_10203 [Capsicum annuum]|uniref:Pentatricopeptide repeat-containing protein n=1 Tax=Capsicum annuum TaxID=4072 RepID=A0A2G3A1I1_CAPAN|nr:hypothetical protein T459_10203 [Capsicum annuum]